MIIAAMLTPAPAPWIVRGATFALWALAAGSAAYWGLKLSATSRPVSAPVAAPRQVGPVDAVALARLLGSSPEVVKGPQPVALASRFQLLGVAAGERSGGGAAVISIDGKPARPFRVGSALEEGLVLQSVHGRQAVIGSSDGKPVLTLEVPQPRLDTSGRPLPMAVPPPGAPGAPGAAAPRAVPSQVPSPQPVLDPDQAPNAAPR